jgi:2-polyprenyl-3-methyl-5-hydroxy-6-metoxy-1,4-benzoquinol methylase
MTADTLVDRLSRAVLGQTLTAKLYVKLTHRGRIISFDQLSSESEEHLINETRKRWVQSNPDLHLTWNRDISGDAFIQRVLMYTTIQSGKNILEIGPGWGRLLKAILKENLSFENYYGIDISEKNIAYLKNTFQTSNIHFIHGNAEDVKLNTIFDIVISSLTFKHIYPSFEKLLINISQYVSKKGMVFFDLIEGNVAFLERDGNTFIRYYKKEQLKEITRRSNLDVVGFDKVIHAPGYSRLLVIAQKN